MEKGTIVPLVFINFVNVIASARRTLAIRSGSLYKGVFTGPAFVFWHNLLIFPSSEDKNICQ
jgi:hypothetical protein